MPVAMERRALLISFPSATDSSVQTAPPLSLAVTKSEVPYWALCPAKQSVLLRVANAMGINFMVFSTTRIQGHEAYQQTLQRIKDYKMNLVIELPKEDCKEASGRMMKTFSRLKVYAEAANKVYIIAPKTNPYWEHWETMLAEKDYRTTIHTWCGMGLKDSDTNKPLAHQTRISSTTVIPTHPCTCGIHVHTYSNNGSKGTRMR